MESLEHGTKQPRCHTDGCRLVARICATRRVPQWQGTLSDYGVLAHDGKRLPTWAAA